MDFSPRALAKLSTAVALRDVADASYDLVAHIGDPSTRADRIRGIREMRALSAIAWERRILAELLEDDEPAWEEVAALIGWSEGSLRARFAGIVETWRKDPSTIDLGPFDSGEGTVGYVTDRDPLGTAEAVDLWVGRHRPPWDDTGPGHNPVRHALTSS